MSSKGQVVIPQEVRKKLNLRRGTRVQLEVREGAVELRPLPREKGQDWRRWRGSLRKNDALKALEAEHAQEIARGR
ncbi:MAG: AbrB/MazE/SpoVT family DNA-binding domain-containing protein [Armatimonadota bacterium]